MNEIERRKKQHLDLCLNPEVREASCGLDDIRLPFDALFEIAPDKLDVHTKIGPCAVSFPLMFGAMTGGTQAATPFNMALRDLSSRLDLPMCLGSMRAALCDNSLIPTYGSGGNTVFANMGAADLFHYSAQNICKTAEKMGAVGLFIHLNGLQEWVQPGGDHAFSCSFDKLAHFIDTFPMPIFIKEVGSGIGGKCAQKLASLNIAGLETASRGGTSWVKIEALRRNTPLFPECESSLLQIGYSLKEAIRDTRAALGSRTVIASGGIRTPANLVRALGLGADLVAMAQPLYRVFDAGGADALEKFVLEFIDVSKLIWRSTGAHNVHELRKNTASENGL